MASRRRAHDSETSTKPPSSEAAHVGGSPSFAIETPTDTPIHKGRNAVPRRAIRKRVFSDGDHVLMAVSDGTTAPKNSLLWIPGIPKFSHRLLLDRWLKSSEHKELLLPYARVAQVKFVNVYSPAEKPQRIVHLNTARKHVVNEPESEDE